MVAKLLTLQHIYIYTHIGSLSLSVFFSLSLCLFVLFFSLFLCLSLSLFLSFSVSLFFYFSLSLFLSFSVSLFLCFSLSLSLCVLFSAHSFLSCMRSRAGSRDFEPHLKEKGLFTVIGLFTVLGFGSGFPGRFGGLHSKHRANRFWRLDVQVGFGSNLGIQIQV